MYLIEVLNVSIHHTFNLITNIRCIYGMLWYLIELLLLYHILTLEVLDLLLLYLYICVSYINWSIEILNTRCIQLKY